MLTPPSPPSRPSRPSRKTPPNVARAAAGAGIGIDEAGRGCLAGPVVAAAVLFPEQFDAAGALPGLGDSKKLTEAQRNLLAPLIVDSAAAYGIGLAWQDEVDRINIRNATFRAMARAVLSLAAMLQDARPTPGAAPNPTGAAHGTLPRLIIDGNAVIPEEHWQACARPLPPGNPAWEQLPHASALRLPACFPALPGQCAVVGGDALLPMISAASILAKTARDDLMTRLDGLYPGYGFARHKGYGTREHLAALREKGPCVLHRNTFRRVRVEPQQYSLF